MAELAPVSPTPSPPTRVFSEQFWGAKHEGFSVLYQNLKGGAAAAKELADFLKELAKIQEDAAKSHLKIIKQFAQPGPTGAFGPVLTVWKSAAERLASLHHTWTLKLNELVKEVLKYSDELHRIHKKIKEEEGPTAEATKQLQETAAALHKAKEAYKQRTLEVEKHRRDGSGPKDLEKAEAKCKRAQEDYRSLVDKYRTVREVFEAKMEASASRFQSEEVTHLSRMREFVETYCQIVDEHHIHLSRVHQEFQIELSTLSVNDLLDKFIETKGTGRDKPGPVEFEEDPRLGALGSGAVGPPSDISDKSGNSADKVSIGGLSGSGSIGALKKEGSGFLRRKQKKEKAKKSSSFKSKEETEDGESQKEGGGSEEDSPKVKLASTPQPLVGVDDEGYSKKPSHVDELAASDPWADFNTSRQRFDSSSSDDSDDESRRRKIKVEIKPIEPDGQHAISASVDELRTAVVGLELIPKAKDVTHVMTMQHQHHHQSPKGSGVADSLLRRSMSQSHVNNNNNSGGRPSQDLLGLSLALSGSPNKDSNFKSSRGKTLDLDGSTSHEDMFNNSNGSAANSSVNQEVGDIFAGNQFSKDPIPALPVKQRPSSVQREQISNSLIALPRPPSRHGSAIVNSLAGSTINRRRESPSPIPSSLISEPKLSLARQNSSGDESKGSLSSSSRGPPVSSSSNMILPSRSSFAMSRGPSPLTLSLSDVVPLAVAFQEVCHACFRGADESSCQVRMIGDMMISFPAGILPLLTNNLNNAPLLFRLRRSSGLDSLLPNKDLISKNSTLSTNDLAVFEFKMPALKELLRKQSEMNPNASYFNIDILKYQIKSLPGAASCPLQMVAYWKCTDSHTDLRLDYKYNAHAIAQAKPLQNVSVSAPIDGGVTNMQSKPNATWLSESNRALWKVSELSQDEDNGVGSLRGRFELSNGPGSQGTIAAQFNCEGATLSNLSFELVGAGYRLSLEKKRFVSGKYYCDGNATSSDNRYRYAVPPCHSPSSSSSPSIVPASSLQLQPTISSPSSTMSYANGSNNNNNSNSNNNNSNHQDAATV
ncbi:F-BAR domain only protein 2-like [Tigriopus californicus]|uniref:F-BAR domain only protein 2-like n=1 Tax=Tigriopus californicus TaxID=6832 RepID=UPI0027DA4787|nr:F-BAR domain only protein 2-like [Tigriopus californicus]